MKALVTGASSGIGREIAIYLSSIGYDIIAVATNEEKLNSLKSICTTCVETISLDLSIYDNLLKLYNMVSGQNIDLLVNNAGIGMIGEFYLQDLDKEQKMINININAVHVLTKLFLKDMINRNSGYILNVSSSAAFLPGPLMATYYATKSYVLNLSLAIAKELKKSNSKVKISVLCPGPVDTNFNNRLNIKYSVKPINAKAVAKYAIDKMFKGKTVIIPSIKTKIGVFFSKILPRNMLLEFIYNMQSKKLK